MSRRTPHRRGGNSVNRTKGKKATKCGKKDLPLQGEEAAVWENTRQLVRTLPGLESKGTVGRGSVNDPEGEESRYMASNVSGKGG